MRRRTFIAGSLAALAFPQALLAQGAAYDPTPQLVSVKSQYAVGQLLVLPRSHYLYLVTAPGQAMRYGVGVGKAGLEFSGTATIAVKKEWPTSVVVKKQYETFLEKSVFKYKEENLENENQEFSYILNEYREGLLLFELMQQKIWDKSVKDTLGLQNYFNKNIANYTTKELKSIKGKVMNDYQNSLEQKWVADLRRKNTVEVNKKQLKKLIKFYEKK